jgi:hypothetical protein
MRFLPPTNQFNLTVLQTSQAAEKENEDVYEKVADFFLRNHPGKRVTSPTLPCTMNASDVKNLLWA